MTCNIGLQTTCIQQLTRWHTDKHWGTYYFPFSFQLITSHQLQDLPQPLLKEGSKHMVCYFGVPTASYLQLTCWCPEKPCATYCLSFGFQLRAFS